MKDNLVMKLTNRPISDELQNIIDRLSEGQYVSTDEINETEEILMARTFISESKSTSELKNRERLQAKIIDDLSKRGSVIIDESGKVAYNGIVDKGSRLDIVMGLPSSGKSSAIVNVLSADYHSKIIDCDDAKEQIPEFNNGWGSSVVHKESQRIEKNVFKNSLEKKENIVLPKVGSDYDKLLKRYILPAKEKGYSVYAHYVEVDHNKALGRMIKRFVTDGRFLEPEIMDKYIVVFKKQVENKVETTYEELKNGGMLDGYSKRNNDVKFGEKPMLIEEYERGKNAGDGIDRVSQAFIQGDGRSGRGGHQIRGVDEESRERETVFLSANDRENETNAESNASRRSIGGSGIGLEEKTEQSRVYITIHKAYCNQIPDKIHVGKTFNMISIPKGTILNGKDISGCVINPKIMYENQYNLNEMIAQYDLRHLNDNSILLKNLNEATSEKVDIKDLKDAIDTQKENYKTMKQQQNEKQLSINKTKDKDKGEEL